MADIKSQKERSRNMSAIRSKDTKPEMYIRKMLFKNGFRYRITPAYVPGHPDIYLGKYHLAIYINGCFWHRHEGCKYSYMPKSRVEFWKEKFAANIMRDQRVRELLVQQNYRCLVIWECAIKQSQKKAWSEESLLDAVRSFVFSNEAYGEISTDSILPS